MFKGGKKTRKEIKKMLNGYIIGREASRLMLRSKAFHLSPFLISGTIVLRSSSVLDQLQKQDLSLSEEMINRLIYLKNSQKKLIFDKIDMDVVLPQLTNSNDPMARNLFIRGLIDVMKMKN